MGYFSNLAIDYVPGIHDHSFMPPEQQLLFRLDELQDRYRELLACGRICADWYFPDDTLRYVLPEHLKAAEYVQAAIKLAIRDLRQNYRIHVQDQQEIQALFLKEQPAVQITILEYLASSNAPKISH